jgi:signal transduction histidine kinase
MQVSQQIQRQQQQLLATLLGVFITIVSLSLLYGALRATSFSANTVRDYLIVVIADVLLCGAYILNRHKRYLPAVTIMLTVIGVGFWLLAAAQYATQTVNNTSNFIYGMFAATLLASLLLNTRGMLLTSIAVIISVQFLPRLAITPTPPSLFFPNILLVLFSALLYVFMRHRNTLERLRQGELARALDDTEKANLTLQKNNTELAKANAIAKESIRLKSEFMSTMSHELRTPLNAIRGFCGIMLEGMGGEIDSDATHMVERINANSDRLLHLINDVLDIAKIEAGRLELVTEPFAPHDLAQRWIAQNGVLAQSKGLKLESYVDPALPKKLLGDAERITQIATNLLSNAIKFTQEGQVRLELKADAENWIIQVSDTGVGIPPHALNYIFDEFRQLDGSSKRVYGGTGLGLAIVRNLCRMMDGSVRVTSELGSGSIFTVTLPMITAPQTQQIPQPA